MWLKALITGMDPRRVEFVRCVVTSSWCDPELVREFPVPVEVGGKSSVQRAAADCDLLLVSGPSELAQWLGPERPPCVFVAHGDGIWTRRILERTATAIDHVVAVSRRAQQMVCHGFPTTVIHNGVDASHLSRTTHRHDMRRRLGFSPDDFVIGSVMRLATEKRPELLVEALAHLPRQVKLLLVGWGALQQKLLDLANRVAPLRCSITSAQGNLGDFYQAFDAFCLPSEFEGFGLATLEALLCGVPVVTTNTGFAPELLQDRVHYCQCELSAESVASSMRLLIEHPRWAAGMAAEGQFAAEQFGFASRMCREYEQLIEQLVAQRRSACSAMDKLQSKRDGIIGTSQCP